LSKLQEAAAIDATATRTNRHCMCRTSYFRATWGQVRKIAPQQGESATGHRKIKKCWRGRKSCDASSW
jgi:hypothetical protein